MKNRNLKTFLQLSVIAFIFLYHCNFIKNTPCIDLLSMSLNILLIVSFYIDYRNGIKAN